MRKKPTGCRLGNSTTKLKPSARSPEPWSPTNGPSATGERRLRRRRPSGAGRRPCPAAARPPESTWRPFTLWDGAPLACGRGAKGSPADGASHRPHVCFSIPHRRPGPPDGVQWNRASRRREMSCRWVVTSSSDSRRIPPSNTLANWPYGRYNYTKAGGSSTGVCTHPRAPALKGIVPPHGCPTHVLTGCRRTILHPPRPSP
jgi:hypothetical protein